MAAEDFNAIHKVAYGDSGIPEMTPDLAIIQKDIKFSQKDLMGDYYEQAVRLALPAGFTRAVGDGTAGVVTLNGATAGTLSKAKVYGYQLILQDQISYEDLAKAAKAGEQAYKEATALFFEGMQLSGRKMLEIMSLYGGVGIGIIDTYNSGDPSIVIKLEEWAPQIWAGLNGAVLSVMNGTTTTERGEASIAGVDITNRKITLSTTVSGAAQGDVVYFKDGINAEMLGIHKQLSNTGTIHNINAGVYSNWQAAQYAVGSAAFSFQFLKKGLALSAAKGNMYKTNIYCSLGAYDDLTDTIHQLRHVDKSEVRRIELGSDEVIYKYPGITATIKPHPMVKNGYAYGCTPQFHKRVGAKDLGFGIPGDDAEKIWFHLEGKTGVESRMYSHQGIVNQMPNTCIYWSGIVNSTT